MAELTEDEKQTLLNKKWKLCAERDLAIQDSNDDLADELLDEIKAINKQVYYPNSKQPKPRFFQAVLKEIPDVIKHVYPLHHKEITLEERMGSFQANCPDCNCNSWILAPKESAAVSQGGKAYCECMECGYQTHL